VNKNRHNIGHLETSGIFFHCEDVKILGKFSAMVHCAYISLLVVFKWQVLDLVTFLYLSTCSCTWMVIIFFTRPFGVR